MEKAAEAQRLSFECHLKTSFEQVAAGFNVDLFRALCPAFPKIRILRFDGIEEGDCVELDMNFFLFHWHWAGRVIAFRYSDQELCFIDAGTRLPPFLSYWHHEHRVDKIADGCCIYDIIHFRPGKGWPEFLVRLMITLQMAPRKNIYPAYFSKVANR